MVTGHLSRLANIRKEELLLEDSFPNDKLFVLIHKETLWYDEFVNYLINTRKNSSHILCITIWMSLFFLREAPTEFFGGVSHRKS